MGAFFAKEVVEAAIRIEGNGLSFYRYLSQRQEREDVREVFEYLTGEEQRHIAEFKRLAENLKEPPDLTWEREDFALYLENLADDNVFKEDGSGEKRAKEVQSALDAVKLGIQFEKDTIIFFHELQNLVRQEERQAVHQLIQWEKEHLVRLFGIKRQLEDAERN